MIRANVQTISSVFLYGAFLFAHTGKHVIMNLVAMLVNETSCTVILLYINFVWRDVQL